MSQHSGASGVPTIRTVGWEEKKLLDKRFKIPAAPAVPSHFFTVIVVVGRLQARRARCSVSWWARYSVDTSSCCYLTGGGDGVVVWTKKHGADSDHGQFVVGVPQRGVPPEERRSGSLARHLHRNEFFFLGIFGGNIKQTAHGCHFRTNPERFVDRGYLLVGLPPAGSRCVIDCTMNRCPLFLINIFGVSGVKNPQGVAQRPSWMIQIKSWPPDGKTFTRKTRSLTNPSR